MENSRTVCGYAFSDGHLLSLALTHRSASSGGDSNERLEFLGDSVLSFVVAEHLCAKYPQKSEGILSKMRAYLVCEDTLAECAKSVGLPEMITVSNGEKKSGAIRKSILADAMEAVFAATYLDGGIEPARSMILTLLSGKLDGLSDIQLDAPKTILKEWLSKRGIEDIVYDVYDSAGPDHDKTFYVKLCVCGKEAARGSGHSKKLAEEDAARTALPNIDKIICEV